MIFIYEITQYGDLLTKTFLEDEFPSTWIGLLVPGNRIAIDGLVKTIVRVTIYPEKNHINVTVER